MSIILYKAGNSKKVRGIRCDYKVFDESSYLHNLDQGWHYSPEECYAKSEEEVVDEEETEGVDQEESPEDETEDEAQEDAESVVDPAPEDEIRTAAKTAGLSHWHTKSVDRLIKELKELEDAE